MVGSRGTKQCFIYFYLMNELEVLIVTTKQISRIVTCTHIFISLRAGDLSYHVYNLQCSITFCKIAKYFLVIHTNELIWFSFYSKKFCPEDTIYEQCFVKGVGHDIVVQILGREWKLHKESLIKVISTDNNWDFQDIYLILRKALRTWSVDP